MTLDEFKTKNGLDKPYAHADAGRVTAPVRLDAGEEAFFQLQLTYIERQQHEIKHKPMRAALFIPVTAEAPAGAESIQVRYYDIIGQAKFVHDYASDFPAANTLGSFKTFQIKSIGISFRYSVQEIRRAQMAGLPLDQREALAAEEAIERLIDGVAWLGDQSTGCLGLLNYPGISTYSLPATGTGSSTLWTTKTPQQIIADVTALITTVHVATNMVERPNVLLLPPSLYDYIAVTQVGTFNDKTILAYLEDNLKRIGIEQIDWINELAGIGTAGNIPAGATQSNRIIAYVKSPRHLKLEVPVAFEMFPPQQENLQYNIPCHARTAGVVHYYPLSVVIADGA